jgi:nitrate reductase gamma subunit
MPSERVRWGWKMKILRGGTMLRRLIYFYTSLVDTLLLSPLVAFALMGILNWVFTDHAKDLLFGDDLGFVKVWLPVWVILAAGQSLLHTPITITAIKEETLDE